MMNTLTIAFLSFAAAIAELASGNDFPATAFALEEEPTARHTTSIENPFKRGNATPVGNSHMNMLRKNNHRSLAAVSQELHHNEAYLLQSSEISSHFSISDTFSRALKRFYKNPFGSNNDELSEVSGHDSDFHHSGFVFKKYPGKSCQKQSGMPGIERNDFFLIDRINQESCKTICRYSVNCSGWEYKEIGKKCAIWYGNPIDEYSVVEADACPGVDCYIKYNYYESEEDRKSRRNDDKSPKKKKKKRKKEYDMKGAKNDGMSSSRSSSWSNKNNNIFSIHDSVESGNDASRPCQTSYGHNSNDSRGNYLYGFDCTNDRGGCVPGLLCQPSQLHGSDRWTCQ